jgi:AraC-like DNA-binding protein
MAASGTRVLRHASEHGEWEFVTRPPAPPLAGHVRRYLGYWERGMTFARRIEAATDDAVLIVNLGEQLHVVDPRDGSGEGEPRRAFLAGLWDSYVITEAKGFSSGLQVNFSPLGFHRLIGGPMHELANRAFEVEEVLGAAGRHFVARLRGAASWEARFDLLDAFLTVRLAAARPPAAGVAWACRELEATGGRASIRALAASIGCSQKYLVARFREHVGLPPKTFARILRFQRALRGLQGARPVCWPDLAQSVGYYDQAHFIRDFRAFAGTTPTDFVRRILPDGGGVVAD